MMNDKRYCRYMVFVWTRVDNSEPFDRIEYHTDSEDSANDFLSKYDLQTYSAICIFDRVEVAVIREIHGADYEDYVD